MPRPPGYYRGHKKRAIPIQIFIRTWAALGWISCIFWMYVVEHEELGVYLRGGDLEHPGIGLCVVDKRRGNWLLIRSKKSRVEGGILPQDCPMWVTYRDDV